MRGQAGRVDSDLVAGQHTHCLEVGRDRHATVQAAAAASAPAAAEQSLCTSFHDRRIVLHRYQKRRRLLRIVVDIKNWRLGKGIGEVGIYTWYQARAVGKGRQKA